MRKKIIWIVPTFVVIIGLILSGCGKSSKNLSQLPNNPHPPARTGEITSGTKTVAMTESVGSSGGVFSVSQPGTPLDGFTIDIPTDSYSTTMNLKVSYAPITDQTFGNDINPISPMITIDNGGIVTTNIQYVRIPAVIPDGSFAMGFIYDSKTKQLEGLPLIAEDADSVTIGTTHFCDLFVSLIDKALLGDDIDSGFKPGVDDWQFTNYGSFIAPGGHCEGQSVTAMWYYCTQPDGSDARLWGRYDDNGQAPATPSFWQDDSQGYRFASMVQASMKGSVNEFWQNMAGKKWVKENNKWKLVDAPLGMSDEMTWDCFAYSIKATHEPQLVAIWSSAGGGHAMVVYRISNGVLYVADPNYPGNTDRRINYADGKFSPYNSGANADEIAAGNGKSFEKIMYFAKSTVLSWDTIAGYWAQLKSGTVGDGKFPDYELKYLDDNKQWVPLTDGMKTLFDAIAIAAFPSENLAIYVYRDGQRLGYDANVNFDLVSGNNKLGIYIVGQVQGRWKYIDFQYINVEYEAETTTTKSDAGAREHPVITGITGPTDSSQLRTGTGSVTFSVQVYGGKPPYKENWSADLKTIVEGASQETVTVPISQLRYNGNGWWIYLTLEDSNGEEAAWIDDVGTSHNEFVYGVTLDNKVITEPTFPYKSVGWQ